MTEFEKTGGTYRKEGLYLLPNLTLQEDGQAADIGVWGIRHRRYLKQHHRVLYYNLLTAGKRIWKCWEKGDLVREITFVWLYCDRILTFDTGADAL